MKLPIYLDNHATTPVDPRVLEAMLSFFREEFGNAASRSHVFGFTAAKAVETARAEIARLINAETPEEIIFTSGATESDNLAIKGIAELYREKGNHIITSAIEHRAVIDTCRNLERRGFRVTYLPVTKEGFVDLNELTAAITNQTILISIMHANNEIGTIQPIEKIGKIANEKGVFFHTDAAQTVGKILLDVQKMNVHLASLSAHKMYGPKGVGVLYVRKKNPRVRLEPQIHGGGHERSLRSGTLNVPAIVGFGKAAEIAQAEMAGEATRLLRFRENLRTAVTEKLDYVYVNGSLEQRLPGNLNLSFAFVDGETLLRGVTEKIAVSSGSACASALTEPSYVLKVLGIPENLLHPSIRFGLGRFTTEEEIDFAINHVVKVVKGLRALSPLYQIIQKNSV
jgi:cysteine desulfurase